MRADASQDCASGRLPDAVLGEVEWRYESDAPTLGLLGTVGAGVRAGDDAAIANTCGGGSIVCDEPVFDPGGEGRMVGECEGIWFWWRLSTEN